MQGNRGCGGGPEEVAPERYPTSQEALYKQREEKEEVPERWGGKSAGCRGRASTYKFVVHVYVRDTHTHIHRKVGAARQAQLVTSKASWKSCKCTKEWVKNPATAAAATSLYSPGEKKRGFPRGKALEDAPEDLKTKTFRPQSA